MSKFKFQLGQQARIAVSSETGEVIGRAEYPSQENSYYLRYKSADGRAVQQWWDESALSSADATSTARAPYSAEFVPCVASASRPSSTANATTEASPNPSGSNA